MTMLIPSTNNQTVYRSMTNGIDEKELPVDQCVQSIFDKLNQEPSFLNDLVKDKCTTETVSFIDYIGYVETVYDAFIEKMGLKALKDQSEHVIGEIFDRSTLGYFLYDHIQE